MKLFTLIFLFSSPVLADTIFTTENSAGLKKLSVHTDLEIECKMALGDLKAKIKSLDKQIVSNPCLAIDHSVAIVAHIPGERKKYIGSVLIIE